MRPPFFSVLLPAFNAEADIGQALRDLLAQTFQEFEILVVDDGSTDQTAGQVAGFADPRIRLIRLARNSGLVGALNAGLKEARGQWIARQDADDRCRPDRLARQRNLISQNPRGVLFYSRATLIDRRGWWRGHLRPPLESSALRWDLCFRNPIPHTSAVFPTDLVRNELQGYRGDNVTADFDLWSRLLRRGDAHGDREALVSYRNHGGSIMGKENASGTKPSNDGLREILRSNLRDWAKAGEEDAKVVAEAWLEPSATRWAHYFSARERLAGGGLFPDPWLVGEEDYTLMHRALAVSAHCAAGMLAAMRRVCPERTRSLPQPRTWLIRIARGF